MKKCLLVLLFMCLLTMILNGCSDIGSNENSQEEKESMTEQETTGGEVPETAESINDENDNSFPYYGTWEVRDYQGAAFLELSLDDMEIFRGIMITYQPDSILLDGEKVTDDNFTYETEGTAYHYDSLTETYEANLGEWWNNISEVTYITIDSNESFFGNQFFVVDSDTIWIYYEDVFFLAKKIDR